MFIKPFTNESKNKYYYNTLLEKGSYKDKLIFIHYKCYIMIQLTFMKKLMLIKQMHQKSDICHHWHFLNSSFKFQSNACTINVMIY